MMGWTVDTRIWRKVDGGRLVAFGGGVYIALDVILFHGERVAH